MHCSDSTFHAVCEHDMKYCVLAKKCVHQHYIDTKKETHTTPHAHTHNHCIRSSLNEYDTFPFDSIWQESPVQCVIVVIISGLTQHTCVYTVYMCIHRVSDMCAVVRSNHRSSSPQIDEWPNEWTNERTNERSYDVDCVWPKPKWKGKKDFCDHSELFTLGTNSKLTIETHMQSKGKRDGTYRQISDNYNVSSE